mgnify:CR=1 FL=1
MSSGYFDLTSNAFYILKTGYEDNRSDIAELVEEAEFDEVFDYQEIQRAQQSLMAPNARLDQEISWLPELSQAQTLNVLSLVASGDLMGLIDASKYVSEISKANLLAHFAGTGNVNDALLHALVSAWDEIDQENILNFINDNRLSAGFPSVERSQMRAALLELEKQHARSAAIGVWSLDCPGEVMDQIVEAELLRNPSSSFLEQFVRSYDTLSEPDLARISDEIDKVISEAKNADADLEEIVTRASDLLVRWDEVNQPVQVYEQHQGHEEGRSKRIYEKLRSLSLDLANNRSEFTEARRLSEALLQTFPELESVAEVLKEDVTALEDLAEKQKNLQEYEPLIEACEAAKTKLPTPVSTVLKAFKVAVSKPGDASIPVNILRDFALHINNDCDDAATAFELLDGALNIVGYRLPQELAKRLKEDREILHRSWKMNELQKNSDDLTAMSQIADDMLKYARGSDRAELLQLKNTLDKKRRDKKVKWVIYAAVAATIGFVAIADEMGKPSNRANYQPSAPRVSTQTPTPTQSVSSAYETRPPVGKGLTLNRSQIRYCIFQEKRLDMIKTLVRTNDQIDKFNVLISDYNSRCSNFRYRQEELGAVELEARARSVILRGDARKIVSSW